MKRAEKITLLTKVLSGDAPRQRLQQTIDTAPRPMVFIDNLGSDDSQPITDDDAVTFHDRGQQHQMTLGEACQYARRYSVRPLVVDPVKR